MVNFPVLLRRALRSAMVFSLMLLSNVGHTSTNSAEILSNTLVALPSCLAYQVKGVCFFLKCNKLLCTVTTSVRIQHYVPDAIISTYNDPLLHPWAELGRPLATTLAGVGSVIVGGAIDSSSTTNYDPHEAPTFKSADAIGNPVGLLAYLTAGGAMPDLPKLFSVPGFGELLKFPTEELPRIVSAWASVPFQLGNQLLETARALAKTPIKIYNAIMSLPAKVAQLQSAIGKVGDVVGGTLDAVAIGSRIGKLIGIDLGPLKTVMQMVDFANGGGIGVNFSPGFGSFFCPGSASAFALHYQSDLDAIFWRGVIPAESLYPGSWVPGIDEVGSGLQQTWGGRYPRTGEVVQQHPVKASAVLAERVASIIKKPAQPHIYSRMATQGGGFRYFSAQTSPKWQMLYPVASSGCQSFGRNDSVSLTSFGDGKTSSEDGYVWNLWQQYDCCQNRGKFLFTVP